MKCARNNESGSLLLCIRTVLVLYFLSVSLLRINSQLNWRIKKIPTKRTHPQCHGNSNAEIKREERTRRRNSIDTPAFGCCCEFPCNLYMLFILLAFDDMCSTERTIDSLSLTMSQFSSFNFSARCSFPTT